MRVKRRWCYLYRAINATGTTIDFGPDLATASQDLNAERRRHGLFRRGTQMFSSTEGSLSMQPREQGDTGVDVGSNETAPARRSADPGRLRGRCLAARGLAAGLLVAVAALLTLPLQAEAQKTTFVSNTGQSTDPDVREVGPHGHLWQLQAQQFRTGDNEGGYTLSAIQVRVDDFGSNSRPKVSIYTTSSGNPGTSLYVLTNPATLNDDAINTFRAPANATLEKDTNYFVVFEELGSGSNLRYDLEVTTSNAEDSGKASGWNITNSSRQRSTNSSNLGDLAGKLKIAVRGTLPPALSIADASAAENAGHLLFDVTLSRSFQNTVKVDFETISGGTATEGVDYHARRTYTHVILAGDKTAQMGFALIEDTVAAAGETVKVRLSNARVVDAYGDKIADLDITTAEATGTITAPPTTTTNVPGLTIGIKDATGDEDDGYLDFRVRLSRKHDDYVCYDFETISGGTAAEGTDYLKFPKATYWMQIGKRVDKPFVRLIDDSVNDNGETVKVKISNARLCDDASQTLSITRAEATGTIRNSDPLPQALMARFGRTAAVHVVEHVEERLAAPREVGVEAQVAGRQLRPGMEREMALDFLSQLGSSAGMHAPGAGSPGARSGSPMGAAAGSIGLAAGMGGPAGGGMGLAADPMNGMAGPDGGLFDSGLSSMGLGGENLLTSSSFALTRETRQGGILSFWSRGARSSFAGREEALSLGGDVRTTMFGADYAKGPLVTGLSLSNSRGLGEYAGVSDGQVASAVTGLYPWLGYKLSDRVSVWGVTGYGKGALTLTPGEGAALTSGLSMAMAAAGTRGALVAGGASGFELAFKADALWVGTSIDGVEGPGGNLTATAAAVTRFRTGLEAARGYALAGRLSLRPSVEVGLRHDGGDAENGAGLDVGGGLVVSDTSTGLTVDLRVRMLVMHQADGFSERGMALSLSYNPTPSTPLGFTARVAPSWGGEATSGAEAMWGRETMAGMANGGLASGNRLDGEVGYGLPVGSRFVGTPRVGVSTSEYGRDYRIGYGLGVLDRERLNLELGVDAHRRESPMLDGTDNGFLGRATMRW